MAPHIPSHNYTPLPPSEDGQLHDKDTAASTDSRVTSRLHTRVQTYIVVFFAFLAGALLSPIAQNVVTSAWDQAAGSESHRLQKLLSFPTELRTFIPDDNFTSPPSASSTQTDDVWMELLGPSRGFIALESPEATYGLRPGRELVGHEDSQVYGVSMFHQLHCLIMIRDLYYNALHSNTNKSSHNHGSGDLAFDIEHTEHCFDYLQQSIRCAGLMQIEVPHGSRNNIFDGYGTEHTCTSWTSVVDFMNKHRVGRKERAV